MPLNYRKIGENLAKRRKELNLKQYEVCERADINYKYLSNIETARSIPSLEVFIRLCKALETSPDDMIKGISLDSVQHPDDEILLEKFHSLSPEKQRFLLKITDMLKEDFDF